MAFSTVLPAPPAASPHPQGSEGSQHRHPNPTLAGSGARGRGQLLPLHPCSPESAAPGRPGDLRGPRGAADQGSRRRAPPYLALAGPRLGHPPGARLSARSLAHLPAAAARQPGPSAGRSASASWRTGLARGPGKRVQLAEAPPALAALLWLPACPRPAYAPPSSAAALFPPLRETSQTGFSAPGCCL